MSLTRYLAPIWLFAGAYFVLNAVILLFVPIVGFAPRPDSFEIPPDGYLLGGCDVSRPSSLNGTLNSVDCFSTEGEEGTFSCGDPGDDDLLVSFDEKTGEVYCKPNPAKSDQFASDARIQEMIAPTFITLGSYAGAVGAAMIVISGKGLMKSRIWAYRSAVYLSVLLVAAGGLIVFAFIPAYFLPTVNSGSESMNDIKGLTYDISLAFGGLFVAQLAAGAVSLVILTRRSGRAAFSSTK